MIYKICTRSEWENATSEGAYRGSTDDLRDGFIHFSSAHQLAATALKYFHGQPDLVLVAVPAERLGPALRYEPSRGGDLFPHLYGALPTEAASWVVPLVWDGARFRFPDHLP